MSDVQGLPAVVGENMRRLRVDHGLTLEAVAKSARQWGLKWNVSRVSEFEQGKMPVSVALLMAAADIVQDLTGADVTLASFFEGSGRVVLAGDTTATREWLRKMVRGGVVKLTVGDMGTRPVEEQSIPKVDFAGFGSELDSRLPPGNWQWGTLRELMDTTTIAEERAAKALGQPSVVVSAWSRALWGKSLADERDARAGAGASAQARGRVTRVLIAQMREAIETRMASDG